MSLHDENVIKQGDKYCWLCLNLDAVPHLQLQPNFPTLKWLGVDWVTWSNRKKVWTKAKHIFQRSFQLRRRCVTPLTLKQFYKNKFTRFCQTYKKSFAKYP